MAWLKLAQKWVNMAWVVEVMDLPNQACVLVLMGASYPGTGLGVTELRYEGEDRQAILAYVKKVTS